jgi:hypothetical protein
LDDLSPPVPNCTFGRVAAIFRLRNLYGISIYPLDDEKRRLKPAATITYNIKSFNLVNKYSIEQLQDCFKGDILWLEKK